MVDIVTVPAEVTIRDLAQDLTEVDMLRSVDVSKSPSGQISRNELQVMPRTGELSIGSSASVRREAVNSLLSSSLLRFECTLPIAFDKQKLRLCQMRNTEIDLSVLSSRVTGVLD